MQRHVVLVGPMGVGKSTVGRRLARRLGAPFVDLDETIAQAAGMSVPEIFDSDGEPGFRARETAALARVLAEPPAVIATGGGAVVDVANRVALTECAALVVWLDADVATLVRRVGDGRGRPLLDGDVHDRLRRIRDERADLYAEVSGLRLDTSAMGHDAVVDRIARARTTSRTIAP